MLRGSISLFFFLQNWNLFNFFDKLLVQVHYFHRHYKLNVTKYNKIDEMKPPTKTTLYTVGTVLCNLVTNHLVRVYEWGHISLNKVTDSVTRKINRARIRPHFSAPLSLNCVYSSLLGWTSGWPAN